MKQLVNYQREADEGKLTAVARARLIYLYQLHVDN